MSCPTCRPSGDARKVTHCEVGFTLFREYKEAAQAYSAEAMKRPPGPRRLETLRQAHGEAGDRYRRHTDEGWTP
jgi:hypothetical protein